MADLNKIIEDLSSLTVVEAAELSKQLEEKWGVTAAAAVAAGLANIRKILKQDVGGGGGGSAESASTPSTAEAKPPAAEMMSGKFELGGAIKPEPVKDGYHDHGCDMLRYFFINQFPIKNREFKVRTR